MPEVLPPEPEDISLLLHTSGTTSRPKIVPDTHARRVVALYRPQGDRQLHRLLELHPFPFVLPSPEQDW